MNNNTLLLQEFVKNTTTVESQSLGFSTASVVTTTPFAFIISTGERPSTADTLHNAAEDIRSPLTGQFPRSYFRNRLEEIDPEHKARAVAARMALAEEQAPFKPVSLATLRLRKGLTQKDLADLLETSQPHIARIESGSYKVYLHTAIRISQALGITLDELTAAIQLNSDHSKLEPIALKL